MSRVETDSSWSLFSPNDAPLLLNSFGAVFDSQYENYEASAIPRSTVPARTIWNAILECQIETGGPFMLYKDAINSMFSPHLTEQHSRFLA